MGDPGSIPGLGRSPGKGKGNPLRYSCLGNPTDRGAWVPHWARTCAVLLTHLTDKEFRFRKVKWLIQDHTAWIYIWKSQSPCFQNSLPVGVSNGCWAVFFKIFSYNLLLFLLSLLFFFFFGFYSGWTTIWQIAYLIKAGEIKRYMVIFAGSVWG